MRPERIISIALLVLVGLIGKGCYDAGKRREGALQERLGATTDSLRRERRVTDSIAKAYRVDTIRLTRTLTRRDTVLRTVERFLTDTVPVPVEVVREIVKADSVVIAQCLQVVRTCEAETSSLRRRLTLTEQQRDVYRQQRPSPLSTWLWRAVAFELGRISSQRFP